MHADLYDRSLYSKVIFHSLSWNYYVLYCYVQGCKEAHLKRDINFFFQDDQVTEGLQLWAILIKSIGFLCSLMFLSLSGF